MFNVLPDSFKDEIRGHYKKRRLVVWLATVFLLEISLLIFLLPSYISLYFTQHNLLDQNNQFQSDSSASVPQSSDLFKQTNATLSALSANLSTSTPDALISHLTSLKTSSIRFKEIVYTDQTATTSTIVLKGVAATRESLLSFSKQLEADTMFKNVNLPVSSFVKDTNIDFSITMTANI